VKAGRVLGFQENYRQNARPFDWTSARTDLLKLTRRLQANGHLIANAA